jgi:hypothetical protein
LRLPYKKLRRINGWKRNLSPKKPKNHTVSLQALVFCSFFISQQELIVASLLQPQIRISHIFLLIFWGFMMRLKLKCPTCSAEFSNPEELREHRISHKLPLPET